MLFFIINNFCSLSVFFELDSFSYNKLTVGGMYLQMSEFFILMWYTL